jgi:putative N6-adenine-specific DNA methylase
MSEQFFATCPRGLESVLAQELTALGAERITVLDGGVGFAGEWRVCYAANLESRVASRILWQVARDRYRNEQDVFDIARLVKWDRWSSASQSIRVDVSAIKSPLNSLDFTTLRVKDAVCDTFRAKEGRRPDVDTKAPDVRIQVFLTKDSCTLYLDTSGEPLFKRGYRQSGGEAPLRENLAAGILRLSGWRPNEDTLLDPMCGSGTLLSEAAMMAIDRAPGLGRAFGFERLKHLQKAEWEKLRDDARNRIKTLIKTDIYGSDLYGDVLKAARANFAALGVESAITLKQVNVLEVSPPTASGILVTNPPYGVRLNEMDELAAFYPRLGDTLKQRFAGWTAYILTADLRLAKLIGLKASKRTPLFNGALECRLFEFRVVAGGMRDKPAPPVEPGSL